MKNREVRINPRGAQSGPARGLFPLALIVSLICVGAWAQAASDNPVGGDGVIPVNPNFNPGTVLYFPIDTPPPAGTDIVEFIATSPILSLRPFAGTVMQPGPLRSGLAIQVTVPTQLGAALSSSLSAGNRPSVLTPYAGVLMGEGDEAVRDSFGSLITNKATTLGRGKLGIGLSYQHAQFNRFDDADIGDQIETNVTMTQYISAQSGTASIETIDLDPTDSIHEPYLITDIHVRAHDVEFKADVVTLALTYGLLENVDIGALIPYIWLNTKGRIDIDYDQRARIRLTDTDIENPLQIDLPAAGSSRTFKNSWDRDFSGFGDIILFTKWQAVSQYGLPKRWEGPVDLALQLEVKLATGDDAQFLGTGNTDVALRLLIQREIYKKLRVRGEVGYNLSGLGSEYSTFDYKVGGEWIVLEDLSASVEFIGNYSRAFESQIDVVAGAKYAVSRDFRLFAGVRAPLNDNGLRYRYSPIVGVEYTFSPTPEGAFEGFELPEVEMEETTTPRETTNIPSVEQPIEAVAAPSKPMTIETAAPVAPAPVAHVSETASGLRIVDIPEAEVPVAFEAPAPGGAITQTPTVAVPMAVDAPLPLPAGRR